MSDLRLAYDGAGALSVHCRAGGAAALRARADRRPAGVAAAVLPSDADARRRRGQPLPSARPRVAQGTVAVVAQRRAGELLGRTDLPARGRLPATAEQRHDAPRGVRPGGRRRRGGVGAGAADLGDRAGTDLVQRAPRRGGSTPSPRPTPGCSRSPPGSSTSARSASSSAAPPPRAGPTPGTAGCSGAVPGRSPMVASMCPTEPAGTSSWACGRRGWPSPGPTTTTVGSRPC